MEKCEKSGVEIELEHQCMYSYEFSTAGNKEISIGLLKTAFFYMQNNVNSKYMVNPQIELLIVKSCFC